MITGLTKAKLGDTFAGLKNVTLATSNGLVYSYGQNLQPRPHYKRTKLHHLATAAAAAANAGSCRSRSGTLNSNADGPVMMVPMLDADAAAGTLMEGSRAGSNASLAYLAGG